MRAKRCTRFKTVRGPGGKRVRRCSRYALSPGPRSSRSRTPPRRGPGGNGARCIKRKLVWSGFWRKQIFRCARMRWPDGRIQDIRLGPANPPRSTSRAVTRRTSTTETWGDSPSLIGAAAAANSKVFLRNEQLDRRIVAPGGVVLPLYRCGEKAGQGLSPQVVKYLREEMGKLQPKCRVQVPVQLKRSRARA